MSGHPDATAALSATLSRASPQDLAEVLPVLFLVAAQALPNVVLPPAALALVQQWLTEVVLVPKDASTDVVVQAVQAHIAGLSTPGTSGAALWQALQQTLRQVAASGATQQQQAFVAFLGETARQVPTTSERPAGAVSASPLSRFELQHKFKPKE
jgi:hypothetical protein